MERATEGYRGLGIERVTEGLVYRGLGIERATGGWV